MRGRQELAVTTGYHEAIIIQSCHAPQQMGAVPRGIAPSQDHTCVEQCVLLSRLRNNYFGTRDFDSPNVWPNRVTLLQDAQKVRPARPQASRNRRRTLKGYVEDFDELRTKLADFFSILLLDIWNLPINRS